MHLWTPKWTQRWPHRPRVLVCLLVWAGFALVGCGTWSGLGADEGFPNSLRDLSGEDIHIATLQAIVNDDDLDDAEKREALEELGIEDEDVQDYILDNFQSTPAG